MFFIFFSSCGKDQLKNKTITSTNNTTSFSKSVSCMCTSDYFPVCGSDLKDYSNACLAKCFGNDTYSQGHCSCKNELIVCGVDNQNYTECDAKKSKIEIASFTSCETRPL